MPYKNSEAQKAAQHAWYLRNKANMLQKQSLRKADFRRQLHLYKLQLKCERCPESEPCCLDFHHRDPSQKKFEVANAVSQNRTFKRVMEEIDKCMVLCANCHRKQHHKERQALREARNKE